MAGRMRDRAKGVRHMTSSRPLFGGAILLYFIIVLEVLIRIRNLGPGTGWGKVPTPLF